MKIKKIIAGLLVATTAFGTGGMRKFRFRRYEEK